MNTLTDNTKYTANVPLVVIERFASKITIQDDGCWQFSEPLNKTGYGQFRYLGNTHIAHRWIYQVLNGVQLVVNELCDHLCRNRGCVNPKHIDIVDSRTNVLRGESRAAQNARKTHCKRGHEFTIQNTRITPQNTRVCRTCQKPALSNTKQSQS